MRGGIETSVELYCVASTRLGAVSRMAHYFDEAESLEAVGLSE
jgi:hypothetical protein